MSNYVKFITQDNEIIYVEIESQGAEQSMAEGEVEAALLSRYEIKQTVTDAQDIFDDALAVVKRNASAFISNVRKMSDLPNEVEITFGLKADGELGNFVVAKVGVEASYTVKLTWKKPEETK